MLSNRKGLTGRHWRKKSGVRVYSLLRLFGLCAERTFFAADPRLMTDFEVVHKRTSIRQIPSQYCGGSPICSRIFLAISACSGFCFSTGSTVDFATISEKFGGVYFWVTSAFVCSVFSSASSFLVLHERRLNAKARQMTNDRTFFIVCSSSVLHS